MYWSELYSGCIRRLSGGPNNWWVDTVAGACSAENYWNNPGPVNGPASLARFFRPSGLALLGNDLLIVDSGGSCGCVGGTGSPMRMLAWRRAHGRLEFCKCARLAGVGEALGIVNVWSWVAPIDANLPDVWHTLTHAGNRVIRLLSLSGAGGSEAHVTTFADLGHLLPEDVSGYFTAFSTEPSSACWSPNKSMSAMCFLGRCACSATWI